MKKLFKFLGVILLLLIGAFTIYYFTNNESLPQGKKGKEADELAQKMLIAIDHENFKNTEILEWTFTGNHSYKWYKQENIVEVSWDKNKVILHLINPKI